MYNKFGDYMNKKLKAVILDGYTENPGDLSWDCIGNLTDLTVYDRTPDELVLERAKDAEILIVNKVHLTENTISQLPNLKFVATLATGYNQIDETALRKRGIPLSNIPSYSTNAVAQMVFAYILESVNRVSEYSNCVKKGEWTACKDFCFWNRPLYELNEKTLGIIGFGKIGRRVSEIAHTFGMNVIVYTPSGKKADVPYAEFTDMDTVLKSSDFVTVHCPLTDKTSGLINKKFIDKLKDDACLINTARGGIANETDIAAALHSGKLSCYCADVLSSEPPKKDNPLLTAPNCFITPHIAWAAYETRLRLLGILEKNIRAFLSDSPINVVN